MFRVFSDAILPIGARNGGGGRKQDEKTTGAVMFLEKEMPVPNQCTEGPNRTALRNMGKNTGKRRGERYWNAAP